MPGPVQPHQQVQNVKKQQHQQQQQIDFKQAIKFVNKIKKRFTSDTDVYKKFLEILQNYSKMQRSPYGIKEVYAKVSDLFKDQPDLLQEFKHFLPDVRGDANAVDSAQTAQSKASKKSQQAKRAASKRKAKKEREKEKAQQVTPALTKSEKGFFQTIKQALKNDELYHEILKCLHLYTEDLISRDEMLTLLEELFGRHHLNLYQNFKGEYWNLRCEFSN